MLKKLALFIPLGILAAATVWVFAAGTAEDPLVSLSYLTEIFAKAVDAEVEARLDASDKQLLGSVEVEENTADENGGDFAEAWTETRMKREDALIGVTGTSFLLLAGEAQVGYNSGAVVDVTDGSVVESGSKLIPKHRYLVAEDTMAAFVVTTKTAVVNYQGEYRFVYSDAPDQNAMAYALKSLHLFRGTLTNYGDGFDLELVPTRLHALIMFIRVLGEEEEALAWSGTEPFVDIEDGSQAYHYVGYAYEKGYTNGCSPTEFCPDLAVNARQYAEFMLRAMGYSSVANTDLSTALDRAQEAGLLTANEAVYLESDSFLRADLVYISYYALHTRLPDGMTALADQLQTKGVFSPAEWSAARSLVPGARM